jgi:lysophospholipase L1-like esterase
VRSALIILAALLAAAVLAGVALVGPDLYRTASDDPLVWEAQIAEFEEQARRRPTDPDAILFVGSSSIRFWDDLAEDMAPLAVIRRGFGGAKITDVLHYADRLIIPLRPRAIVVYVGGNDLTGFLWGRAKDASEVVDAYERLVAEIHASVPDVPIFFVSLRPSTTGASSWPRAQQVNADVRALSFRDPRLHYIEANGPLVGADGTANRELLAWDGLHLNRKGYQAWAPVIRAHLVQTLGPGANVAGES